MAVLELRGQSDDVDLDPAAPPVEGDGRILVKRWRQAANSIENVVWSHDDRT